MVENILRNNTNKAYQPVKDLTTAKEGRGDTIHKRTEKLWTN